MKDTRQAPRGGSRRGDGAHGSAGGYPRSQAQGGYGPAQGSRGRAQAQGNYQHAQAAHPPQGGAHAKALSLGGVSIPKPALRIGTVLLLAAIALAVIVGLVNNAGKQNLFSKTITQGVKIDDRDVSGMEADKLKAQLENQYDKKINDISIKITYNGQVLKTLNGKDIGMSDDVDKVIDEARVIARMGSEAQRKAEAKQVRAEGRDFKVALEMDPNALKIKLTEIASSVSKTGQDATVSFNPGLADFVDPEEPTPAELDKISKMFMINPESDGQTVDVDAMQQKILETLKESDKCEIELVATPFVAKVTSASLEETFKILSVFHTHISSLSPQERIDNIKLAISKFNGMKLDPGQEISFNDTTGPRTGDNGYQMAHVINGNQYVDDWGGGVCQASTTLYNAALKAGCKITDSGHHSIPSDYVDKGFDAMVNYPSSDLKFVNPYDTPIYIKTFVTKKNNVYVMFFGKPLPDGQTIKLENEIVFQGPLPETDTVVDADGTYADFVTYRDEEYKAMAPHPAIDVITYRIYLDKDGKEIKREKLREDKFKEIKGKTIIGKEERPADSAHPGATAASGTMG